MKCCKAVMALRSVEIARDSGLEGPAGKASCAAKTAAGSAQVVAAPDDPAEFGQPAERVRSGCRAVILAITNPRYIAVSAGSSEAPQRTLLDIELNGSRRLAPKAK